MPRYLVCYAGKVYAMHGGAHVDRWESSCPPRPDFEDRAPASHRDWPYGRSVGDFWSPHTADRSTEGDVVRFVHFCRRYLLSRILRMIFRFTV